MAGCTYGEWTRKEDESLLNLIGGIEQAREVINGNIEIEFHRSYFHIGDPIRIFVDESLENTLNVNKLNDIHDNGSTSKRIKKIPDKRCKRVLRVFTLKTSAKTKLVIAEIIRAGYKPASIHHLYSLSKRMLASQLNVPIVALGSNAGSAHAVILNRFYNRHVWYFVQRDRVWNPGCKVLTISN